MKHCLVYMTFPDRVAALDIARVLIDEKLAACVNIFASGTSVYAWDGQVCEEPEVYSVAKTTQGRVDALSRRVTQLHDYDVPSISVYQMDGGHPPFLGWISASVKAD